MEPGLQMKEGRGEEEEERSVGKEGKEGTPEEKGARPMPRWIYLGIMFVMVLIATVVISANGKEYRLTCTRVEPKRIYVCTYMIWP